MTTKSVALQLVQCGVCREGGGLKAQNRTRMLVYFGEVDATVTLFGSLPWHPKTCECAPECGP